MKLTCDLCDGKLEMKADGAVCSVCGIAYSRARLDEKLCNLQPTIVCTCPTENTVQTIRKASEPKSSGAVSQKAQKKMKVMWRLLALVGLFAFFAILFSETAQQELFVYVASYTGLLGTLFVFRPWKAYGGACNESKL